MSQDIETTDDILNKIAYQLERHNDLLEEQFEYDKKKDQEDTQARIERDSIVASMGETVKQGMNFVAPPKFPQSASYTGPDRIIKQVKEINDDSSL